MANPSSNGDDGARSFRTEHVRERRPHVEHLGVATLPLEGIPFADSCCFDADQNLAPANRRHRDFLQGKGLDAPESVESDGPHGGSFCPLHEVYPYRAAVVLTTLAVATMLSPSSRSHSA